MAEQLDTYEFKERRRGAKYPWDEWLNGRPWRLTHGDDFACTVKSFRNYVYAVAKTRGLRVRVSIGDDCIVIQAYTPNDA